MQEIIQQIVQKTYQSSVLPEVRTQNENLSRVITWADANPVAWKIVTNHRSKAFGLGSCVYIGWAQRSMAPEAILERVRHLYEVLHGREYPNPSIFRWRACFTLEHYRDKGFTGGFFQQHDERYPRACLTFSKLNDLGFVGACEGDMDSTLTMLLFAYAFRVPGFISDPVVDTAKNALLHFHCHHFHRNDGIVN